MESALVSIIVAVYRVQDYLDACVESLLNQSYRNVEVLLIDDGSDDNCPKMCDDWQVRDGRVRVFHTENRGQSAARNLGIDEAAGEFVTFVDSDDFISLRMIEKMVKMATELDADICLVELAPFFGNESPQFRAEGGSYLNTAKTELLKIATEGRNWGAGGKMYRREILSDAVRFPVGLVMEDVEFTVRAFVCAGSVASADWALYGYRRRAESTMASAERSMPPDLITVLESSIRLVKDNYGDTDPVCDKLITAMVFHASTKLEHLGLVGGMRSFKFIQVYKSFVKRWWPIVRDSPEISSAYKFGVRLSSTSPLGFVLLVKIGHKLKQSILPSIARKRSDSG